MKKVFGNLFNGNLLMALYYLFKKFLVSDWLTANCEIVISTQWLKPGAHTAILVGRFRFRCMILANVAM